VPSINIDAVGHCPADGSERDSVAGRGYVKCGLGNVELQQSSLAVKCPTIRNRMRTNRFPPFAARRKDFELTSLRDQIVVDNGDPDYFFQQQGLPKAVVPRTSPNVNPIEIINVNDLLCAGGDGTPLTLPCSIGLFCRNTRTQILVVAHQRVCDRGPTEVVHRVGYASGQAYRNLRTAERSGRHFITYTFTGTSTNIEYSTVHCHLSSSCLTP
jgi:hypothetical protein